MDHQQIADVFPIEIWEKIILFSDGRALVELSETSPTFEDIINSLDKRQNIWENRCHEEIPEADREDIYRKLYPDKSLVPQWQHVYNVWCKWKLVTQSCLEAVKVPKSYLWIADIKVSNEMIVIADKIGFTLLNSATNRHKRYKIGPVKHIELIRRPNADHPGNGKFLHDVLDCTVANFHLFFDLHCVKHLRADKHENEIVRYCCNEKKSKFMPPILEANIFDDMILLVDETSIKQAVEPMSVICKYDYSWSGARCWFLWHARLLFCAKDNTLDIYLNGRMRNFPFEEFPKITAIFYFGSVLFLGSAHGSLYIYRVEADNIFSFNFRRYDSKLDLCTIPIVAIDIMENNSESSCIIVATDHEVYRVIPTFSTHQQL